MVVDYDMSGMQSIGDEGIGDMYDTQGGYEQQWGPVMQSTPTWGFEQLHNQSQQPPNSDAGEMFADGARSAGSNDSTRVEGEPGSDVDEGFQDTPMFSDANPHDDSHLRSQRESAPPPTDVPHINVPQPEDEDDENIPVHEIPPPPEH